jgi:hypothetical protein
MERVVMRLGFIGFGLATIVLLGTPVTVFASTDPEPTSPPCDVGTANAVAGTPFEVSGTRKHRDEPVGIIARNAYGDMREGSVALLDDTWRGVLLFGNADGGDWTIDISVDGVNCVSQLTVTLPAGVVAPSRPPRDEPDLVQTTAGIDAATVRTAIVGGAAALVVASWVFLALLGVARLLGGQPFAHRNLRRVASAATFVAVLGAFMGIGLFAYLAYSIGRFDTGIPPEQKVLLDVGLWVVGIVGACVGVLAARRLPGGEAAADRSGSVSGASSD